MVKQKGQQVSFAAALIEDVAKAKSEADQIGKVPDVYVHATIPKAKSLVEMLTAGSWGQHVNKACCGSTVPGQHYEGCVAGFPHPKHLQKGETYLVMFPFHKIASAASKGTFLHAMNKWVEGLKVSGVHAHAVLMPIKSINAVKVVHVSGMPYTPMLLCSECSVAEEMGCAKTNPDGLFVCHHCAAKHEG